MMEEAIEHIPVEGVDLRQVIEKTEQKTTVNPTIPLLVPEEAAIEVAILKRKEPSYEDPVSAAYKRHMNNHIGSPEWKTDGAETIRLFHQTLHGTGECLTK